MAGLGRRTHYRKHLTDSVLFDKPEPQENERIAKVVATRGSNQFDVLVASSKNSNTPQLAILPTKFNKLVWVKRNDFVIVQTGDDKDNDNDDNGNESKATTTDQGGIRYMISHILYKEQVKHLKSKGLWPKDDPEFSSAPGEDFEQINTEEKDDGIVYATGYDDEEDDDADLFVNTNRINRLEIEDSSDEDSSDEE